MSNDQSTFDGLMSRLLEGAADDADRSAMRELLVEQPELRSEYADFMQTHALLHWQHSVGEELDGGETTLPLQAEERPDDRSRRLRLAAAWGSAAAAVAAVVATLFFSPADRQVARQPHKVKIEVIAAKGVESAPGGATYASLQQYELDRISIDAGQLEFRMESGPMVRLTGPAELQFLGDAHARMIRGKLTARVEGDSAKLVVDTKFAQIVDLGTEFGVDVTEPTHTDVVVFEGSVELRDRPSPANDGLLRTVLHEGEAASVNLKQVRRIENVIGLAQDASWSTKSLSGSAIRSIRDNVRDPSAMFYYRIVPNGMQEDATAYVAKRHQWNGLDERGLPGWLVGADLVETFGGDKSNAELEIDVTLNQPGMLYVIYPNRGETPVWVRDQFVDTGVDIGLEYPRGIETGVPQSAGAGKGWLLPFRVWQRKVNASESVTLFAPGQPTTGEFPLMYGIAAKAAPPK